MRVLVTGGAGYVGSHIVRRLVDGGHQVAVLDDLRGGHARAVGDVPLVQADFADAEALGAAYATHRFEAVVHMAADCLVGESMTDPGKYYRNNITGPLAMLERLLDLGVRRMVFSSSAAVYGDPETVPIPEEHPCLPTNTYGETKLAFERILGWFGSAHGLASISLRYFNAAGARPEAGLGEDHDPETHLIPNILNVALGKLPELTIFGDDYRTPDGTCVRDYVHVDDLAEAHVLALERLAAGEPGGVFNLGSERGHSVREVLEVARRITGHPIPAMVRERRPGDPPSLVASRRMAGKLLGWRPRSSDLEEIVRSAWEWQRSQAAAAAP